MVARFFCQQISWQPGCYVSHFPVQTRALPNGLTTVSPSTDSRKHLHRLPWLDEVLECLEIPLQQISEDLAYKLVIECTQRQDLELGRRVLSVMANNGLDSIALLADHLIRLFASCGSIIEANQVFVNVSKPSQYTWNAIIASHAKCDEFEMAFWLYERVQFGGLNPDKFTFLSILKACSHMGSIERCKYIHQQTIDSGVHLNIVVGCTLVDMYAKCGQLDEACRVFNSLPSHDEVSWGVMIAAYAQHDEGVLALECFEGMQNEGQKPNKVTFFGLLKACKSLNTVEHGRCMHEKIIVSKLQSDNMVGSALVDMYAKAGCLEEACNVFYGLPNCNVVTWSALLAGYAQHGEGILALDCYESMQHDGIQPDKVIFLSILKACASIGFIEKGRCIHEQIINNKLHDDIVVNGSLVDMYAKCGVLEEARRAFDRLPNKDIISWGTMITGYAQCGEGCLALECYYNMHLQGIGPNKVIFVSMLKACGSLGALWNGKHTHQQIVDNDLQLDNVLGNAVIDMYAKCGEMEAAKLIFQNLPAPDVISWSTIITGYAQVGEAGLAVEHFKSMHHNGIDANNITFNGILTAFSCAGLVDEGVYYFMFIRENLGTKPDMYHMTSVVDLLARRGCFNELEDFLETTMPLDICLWMTVLSACRLHNNVELGRRCFDKIVLLDSSYAPMYVLMFNLYARAHMQECLKQSTRL